MRAFAELLDALSFAPRRNDKLELLRHYLRTTPDPDRGWALAALTDGLPVRLPLRRVLTDLMTARVDPELYRLSRDYVGDTAETVALLWPDSSSHQPAAGSLGEIVDTIMAASPAELEGIIGGLLDRLDARERWAFLKLIGGALRVGVSARLAKTALADAMGADLSDVEEVWHTVTPPYGELLGWLTGASPRPETADRPHFRPMMLAVAITEEEAAALAPADFAAEWKWDGIRVQVAGTGAETRVYSRTGDDISAAFPEVVAAFAGQRVTVDGELLVARSGEIAVFAELQQRLNRKTVGQTLVRRYPAHVRLYDALTLGADDLRPLPFLDRRRRLEAWHAREHPPATDLSELLPFASWAELRTLREGARAAGIEGLMLKRRDSPYLSGRPKGHWFKWKRDALTLDCVLMYAQRGSGKRSSYYSDYTFGVWRPAADGGRELVPIGKAYSGFTDEELRELDRFIRANTLESFGPVRSLRPALVLEVAFDALQESKRHKSGLAMRFPRIHRIRWDKPVEEADTLETALALV